jgi:hypothetical protein
MYQIIIKCFFNNDDVINKFKFIEFGDLTQVINFIQQYENHAYKPCEYTISYIK